MRYYGPENLRRPERGLGDVFGLEVYDAPPKPRRSRAEQTEFMFKDGDRLILSDANFVGVLHDKHGHIHTPLYPYSAERVSALATAIDSGPLELFVGLRNPASFLSSAYSQALLGGGKLHLRTISTQIRWIRCFGLVGLHAFGLPLGWVMLRSGCRKNIIKCSV